MLIRTVVKIKVKWFFKTLMPWASKFHHSREIIVIKVLRREERLRIPKPNEFLLTFFLIR